MSTGTLRIPEISVKPIERSDLRLWAGKLFYGTKRRLLWLKLNRSFATKITEEDLYYQYFSHKTPLIRDLKDADMYLQINKITNLKIATKKINGIVIRPGEIFSYWKLIGNPSKRKGYKEGMVLVNGTVRPGVGGGLCQLSNLIFWMAIHTPLTVIERHRHGYDVFPDSNRTQPFGSGATCFYPYGDLMLKNDTQDTFQIFVNVSEEYLEGEIRVNSEPLYRFDIVERDHEMRSEYWGGFTRHNDLYQLKYDLEDNLISDEHLIHNSAIMMYSPFLDSNAAVS
ncbi:MAG: VanW family protein [Clostridiales bacterium]|nr:VanW family protein [Clostridiales bacterium]